MPKIPATPEKLDELRRMGEEFEELFAGFKVVSESAHPVVRAKMQINGLKTIKSRMRIALDYARLLKGAFENWAEASEEARVAEKQAAADQAKPRTKRK